MGRTVCKFLWLVHAWGLLLLGKARLPLVLPSMYISSMYALELSSNRVKTKLALKCHPQLMAGFALCADCRRTQNQLNIFTFQKHAWSAAVTGQFYCPFVWSTAVNRPILLLFYMEPRCCSDLAKWTKFCCPKLASKKLASNKGCRMSNRIQVQL